jgi:DNA-binding NtrC family response regulator
MFVPAETAQTAQRIELPSTEFIFGRTVGMREIREEIERATHDDLPVLIEGESGTGKEVIGRFLHKCSVRRGGPFLKFSCAAASPSLLDGEMFGYETGATGDVPETTGGAIDRASGGTLFLDEIDDMDLSLQEKLVRTLKSGHYRRIGARNDVAVNARFVCATSIAPEMGLRNITVPEELLGCFVHRARLLPLRERKEDIPQLCAYLLEKFARDFDRPVPHLSSDALEAFQQWNWPGNVRELENWIARIVIFGAEEVVGLEFSRQLAAGGTPAMRYHRDARLNFGRARRLRQRR